MPFLFCSSSVWIWEQGPWLESTFFLCSSAVLGKLPSLSSLGPSPIKNEA
jgi:hypothetical protein